MDSNVREEFLKVYESYKEQRSSIATEDEILLEMIKLYYDSTKKSDKKNAAKFISKNKYRIQEYGFWKYIDEEVLNSYLN